MANGIKNTQDNKDIKLQKLSEKELINDYSSSYSQNEKAYLIANCSGNIFVRDTNGFRIVSKENVHYLDINKYKILDSSYVISTYEEGKNDSSEENIGSISEESTDSIKEVIKEEAYIEKEQPIIVKNNESDNFDNENNNDIKEECTAITDDKHLRDISLSLMENISYFLFQSKEELEFLNNKSLSSSSGAGGYGLDLI